MIRTEDMESVTLTLSDGELNKELIDKLIDDEHARQPWMVVDFGIKIPRRLFLVLSPEEAGEKYDALGHRWNIIGSLTADCKTRLRLRYAWRV